MNDALCSILCGEDEWCFDGEHKAMKFNSDGIGELWGCNTFQYWIVVDLQWKSISVGRLGTTTTSVQSNKGPSLIGQINLEITLLKRIPQDLQDYLIPVFNELEDDAFQSKVYSIEIEKGNFILPCLARSENEHRPNNRYALRLLFDKSPYPPRKDWMKPDYGPDGCGFWDREEFVGRSTPALDDKRRAMNDPAPAGGWDSCAVC